MLESIIKSQFAAYRVHHRRSRVALIDTHAGDGAGVQQQQLGLFINEISQPSPLILAKICRYNDAQLIVCESRPPRRLMLQERILPLAPNAMILHHNRQLLECDFSVFDWALMVCDPCGYGAYEEHLDIMRRVAQQVKSDIVLTFNEHAVKRIMGMSDDGQNDTRQTAAVRRKKPLCAWMLDPQEWMNRLPGQRMMRSPVFSQSSNFNFRFLVSADYFGNYLQRQKRWEHYERTNQDRAGAAKTAAAAVGG